MLTWLDWNLNWGLAAQHTSLFYGVQTDLNKLRYRGSFTLAEGLQVAPKDPIWHKQRHDAG